jgi:hypothetical protein
LGRPGNLLRFFPKIYITNKYITERRVYVPEHEAAACSDSSGSVVQIGMDPSMNFRTDKQNNKMKSNANSSC